MSRAGRPIWDFDYRPVPAPAAPVESASDLVVATAAAAPLDRLREAFAAERGDVEITELLARPPLFWARAQCASPIEAARVAALAAEVGASVRYVAPARVGSQAWAPRLRVRRADFARPTSWAARPVTSGEERADGGFWFLAAEGGGVAAMREATGTGAGTRLAVIDDDAAGVEVLDLDAEVRLGLSRDPRAQSHGTLMVAWAAGAARAEPPFRGVAPDASPRLYLIPKPGADVVSLPLALVRAVADGADVVVCATYIEGSWSPMLDDALAFAERCGRGGLGAVVVLPTGRETSSPPGAVHASLSLSFGDPAADPRALCIAPAARAGGWFLYRDRKKLARPFANRGPSVRFLAPGDDVAYPLGGGSRVGHAESSGASAIAAGVVLLVLAANPALRLREVLALLESTATPVDPAVDPAWAPFADSRDFLPAARDADGHNAKHGYGALHAERACLTASDPVSWALVRIGETAAAARFRALRRADPAVRAAFSEALARWAVRALLADARASHAARALVRHGRLLAANRRRALDFPPGAFAKQAALLLRGLLEGTAIGHPPRPLRGEIERHLARLAAEPSVEEAWLDVAARLFAAPP